MGKHLTKNDRIKMETMLNSGHKPKEIAEYLHVHRSTITERRNGGNIPIETAITQRKPVIVVIWGKKTMIGTPRGKGGASK